MRTFTKCITIVHENLGLDDRSAYDCDRSWYGLTHTLKAYDVLFDTQYNMSTIVRDGKTTNVPSGTTNVPGGTANIPSGTANVPGSVNSRKNKKDPNFLFRT